MSLPSFVSLLVCVCRYEAEDLIKLKQKLVPSSIYMLWSSPPAALCFTYLVFLYLILALYLSIVHVGPIFIQFMIFFLFRWNIAGSCLWLNNFVNVSLLFRTLLTQIDDGQDLMDCWWTHEINRFSIKKQ